IDEDQSGDQGDTKHQEISMYRSHDASWRRIIGPAGPRRHRFSRRRTADPASQIAEIFLPYQLPEPRLRARIELHEIELVVVLRDLDGLFRREVEQRAKHHLVGDAVADDQ